MKLTVIIVNYNVKYYVEQCLNSLAKALDGIESEIFVVDNHSHDDSVRYLRKRFRDINIIDSNHNLGFSRANNIAYGQSSGEYVLLLNPDTFVGEDTIAGVLAFMDSHPEAGGAGVRMYNSDGTLARESRRGIPSPMTSFYKMCGLCNRFPESRRFGRYYMGYLKWDREERIEVVSGAFFMLRRAAIDKIGFLLDEDFFMYGEDIDLSYRLLKSGYDNWYLPYSILHYKGESTHKSSFRYVHVFYQAMLIFFKKHYGHLRLWITLPIKVAIYFRAVMALAWMATCDIRRSLGFVDRRRVDVRYVFVGGGSMIEQCVRISRRRGLTADFYKVESAEESRPYGDITGRETADGRIYIVYDTEVFSYKQILEAMAAAPDNKIMLGTYSNKTRTIITQDEVIR